MTKYIVSGTFQIEVEAKTPEEAEDMATEAVESGGATVGSIDDCSEA